MTINHVSIQIHPSYLPDSNNCEHLIMMATVGDKLSIQVEKIIHKALQSGTAGFICAGASLGKSLTLNTHTHGAGHAIHCCVKAGLKATTKVSVKTTAKVTGKTSVYAGSDAVTAGAETFFQLGYRAALSGTAIGVVAGVAVAVNLAIEVPLLVRNVYKLHRKKKFGLISTVQYDRGIVQESIASASTVLGAVSGAIVGQVAIPVPIIGAAIGGTLGGMGGQVMGRIEGWAASKLVAGERTVTMLPLVAPTLIDNPSPMAQKSADCKSHY